MRQWELKDFSQIIYESCAMVNFWKIETCLYFHENGVGEEAWLQQKLFPFLPIVNESITILISKSTLFTGRVDNHL